MMILNLSETLAKPLVMAKLNMALIAMPKTSDTHSELWRHDLPLEAPSLVDDEYEAGYA